MVRYELKKIFSKKMNQMLLAIVFFIAIICACFAVGSVRYIDSEGILHTGISAGRSIAEDKNRWQGELTPAKMKKVVGSVQELSQKYPENIPDSEYGKTMQAYEDIRDFMIGVLTPDSEWDDGILYQLSGTQVDNIYSVYKDNQEQMAKEYGSTIQKEKFLKKQYGKIELPLTYKAKGSWDTMLMYIQTYVIIMTIVIGFLATSVFSGEFRSGAEGVFFATKYGRTKAIKSKIVSGILMTTFVYWIGMILLSIIAFGVMGTSGFSTPYQISDPYSIYVITYGEYYLLMLLGGYIASLFSATLTMLITVKMHTPNVAVGVPFFLFCMLPFIGRMLPPFAKIFDLMPCVFSNIIEYVKKPLVFQVGNIVFRQLPFVMLLYTVLFVILLPVVFKSYRRYGVKR